MKITILGSSHGVPEVNRKCSSIMLEVSDRCYFIDIGTPVIEELINRGIPVESVRAIFVTHNHGDHLDGLLSFADLTSWYFTQANAKAYLPDIAVARVVRAWTSVLGFECRLDMNEFSEGAFYNDEYIEVSAIPTQHCEKAYAFSVKAEGKTLIFTGDLKNPKVDFPQYALNNKTELIVCEAAHFPVTDYIPVLSHCSTNKIIINHYHESKLSGFDELKNSLPAEMISLATDNMEIIL